jgi:hypothetical protein
LITKWCQDDNNTKKCSCNALPPFFSPLNEHPCPWFLFLLTMLKSHNSLQLHYPPSISPYFYWLT